ncbi:MAG: FAD:protein FMN transferase [Williamsia sp.]|nr:FAD:protein FMN transferase [Williamsia sp.]
MRIPGIILLFISVCSTAQPQYKKWSFQEPKMGSPFTILLYSLDSAGAAEAAREAFSLVDTLNLVYSDYLPESELNRLCARAGTGQWVPVSDNLFRLLRKSTKAGEASGGSFDITMSPVIRLWRTARQEGRLPDKDSIRIAKQRTGYQLIEFDTVQKRVRLQKKGMRLDLGGIAKGETVQRVCKALQEKGFPYALADAGGDIMAAETPPGIAGWRVAINQPESAAWMNAQLVLRKKAVTTSGDLYQHLEVNGIRYSHIIDPATGWALTNTRNVTVIADEGADADWLTKACSILPINKALQLIKKFPGAEVQIGVLKNNKPSYYRSPGFAAYFHE